MTRKYVIVRKTYFGTNVKQDGDYFMHDLTYFRAKLSMSTMFKPVSYGPCSQLNHTYNKPFLEPGRIDLGRWGLYNFMKHLNGHLYLY